MKYSSYSFGRGKHAVKGWWKALPAALLLLGAAACQKDEVPTAKTGGDDTSQTTGDGFAKGADISWVTEMESAGVKFYNASGKETECMALIRSLGFDSIRLRVWVNPSDGWCNKDDTLIKAWRASKQGFRIMIDFHYSDTWADPGAQYKPSAWEGLSLDELKDAITEHTEDVLDALKDYGITPEWVQVGNEVRPGMLWDTDASVSGATWDVTTGGKTYKTNQENFASFIDTGYHAVKDVFPDAKVIVHLDGGDNNGNFIWIFDMLESYGASYDVIGMSLYPSADDTSVEGYWEDSVNACAANMEDMVSRYGKEVAICEFGMPQDDPIAARDCLAELLARCRSIPSCLGLFYWEPECYAGWNGYYLGAFSDDGRPTAALDPFLD